MSAMALLGCGGAAAEDMVRRRRAAILDERAAMPPDCQPAPLEPPCLGDTP